MNIYDFFNSPDVAEYCQSIGHTFNAIESAVMVSQSNTRTLAEKHAAYRAIIAEYPDMEIPPAFNHEHIVSVNKTLGEIIAHEENQLEKFLLPESNAVYQPALYYKNDRDSYDLELFTSYEKAIADAREYLKEDSDKDDFIYFAIRKKYFDGNKNWVEAKVSQNGEIMEAYISGQEYDDDILLLESCYIDVPVPFKRGDLVEAYGRGYNDVYVLKDICRNNPEYHARMLNCGDISDMTADIYYNIDGSINCECMHFYPDLKYCRRELEGETRILKYISLYIQDKFCLCSLLKVQKYLSADKIMDGLKDDYNLKYELEQNSIGEL